MIKKILSIGCFATIATAIGFNVNKSVNEVSVSELISTNTEALAYSDNGCMNGSDGCLSGGAWYTQYKEYGL